jgi:hypothetical protein
MLITTFFLARLTGQREIAMECEKLMYWLTLGALALATTTGLVTHRGWGDRLAERSVALVTQGSEIIANNAEIAGMILGDGENVFAGAPQVMINVEDEDATRASAVSQVQTRVACVQRSLARHQAEMDRVHAMRIRMPKLKFVQRTIDVPGQHFVIQVPEEVAAPGDTF